MTPLNFLTSFILTFTLSLSASTTFTRDEVFTGEVVHSAQTFDYNKDGLQDLIFSANFGVHLALAPDFKPIQIAEHTKNKKASIHSMIMDVDSDGDMDFIASDSGTVWFENPSSKDPKTPWKKTWITKDITGHHCFLSHDVDMDGKLDLVTNNFYPSGHSIEQKFSNFFPDSVVWFPIPDNPKDSTQWKAHLIADGDAGGGSHYVGFADLDGDGKTEMMQGSKGSPFEGGNYFAFWTRGKDLKTGWTKTKLPETHMGATHIHGSDFNSDGHMDMIGCKGHGTGLVLFLGPDWKTQTVDDTLLNPHAFTTADIDQDGDVDLFACAKGSKVAKWFENDGKGNFTSHLLSDDQQAYDIFIVDLEGDDDLDIVIAGQGSKNIVFFRQD
jgi:hypothetical protein